ncbi:MAG: hypothetical protein Q8P24_13575, partial [Desulfobacterales bacterium]|nr:hypothetical protein [Desulfobacterales bacterium]
NEKGVIKQGIPELSGKVFDCLITANFLATSSVIIRREAFQAFDPQRKFVEDYDLWLKISQNWSFDFVKDIVCRYRVHSGNESADLMGRYKSEVDLKNKYLEANPSMRKKSLWDTEFKMAYAYSNLKEWRMSNFFLKKAMSQKPFEIKNFKLFARNLLHRIGGYRI